MTLEPRFQTGAALTRLALAGLFLSIPRAFIQIEANRLDLDARAPHTIYAITHKRDPDTFVSPAVILAHRGWRALTHDVRFIMRADAFQTGFLTRLVSRPEWLRRALRPFSVGGVLRAAGVYPIDGFHSRPAELWARAALAAEGSMTVGALLAEETRRAVARAAGVTQEDLDAMDARALLQWRYAVALQLPTGPSVLSEGQRRRAERRMVETAREQLRAMADWLRADGSLFLAPEGRLSPNGLFSPSRAGLRLLTRDAPPDTRVQPIAITYDSMTSGRIHMWLDLAEPITDVAGMDGGQLERRLRAAWLSAGRMACAQLASAALVIARATAPETPVTTSVNGLAERVHRLALALNAAGRHVDDALLTVDGAQRRVARYLRYAERHGLASRDGALYTINPDALPDRADAPAALPGVPPDSVGYERYPIRYAWNEAFEALTDADLLASARADTEPANATPYSAEAGG